VLIVIVYGVTSGAAAGWSIAISAGTGGRWSVWERSCDSLSHARERHGPPASPVYKRRRAPATATSLSTTSPQSTHARCTPKLTWITRNNQHDSHNVARNRTAAHLSHLPIQKGEFRVPSSHRRALILSF